METTLTHLSGAVNLIARLSRPDSLDAENAAVWVIGKAALAHFAVDQTCPNRVVLLSHPTGCEARVEITDDSVGILLCDSTGNTYEYAI